MTEPSFDTPQRQSILGIVVYLAKNGRAFLSAAVVLWVTSDSAPEERMYVFLGIFFILLLIIGISYLQYKNFTFHIEKGELIVNRGIIFKERRIIPFDRIQSVHTHQNLVQQLLNLTGLKVDSAGSKGKELEIPALDRHVADALQQYLEEKKETAGIQDETAEATSTETRQELLRLDFTDLLKVGLTENHLRTGLLAIAFVFGYYSQYSSYLEKYVDTDVDHYLPDAMRLGLILVIAGSIFFLFISVVLSLVRTFLKFFDFHAWLEKNVIAINSGLLKRNQYRIPLKKIQYLIWRSNPLRRLLNFETVIIKQAQSAEMKKKEAISIPACRPEHTARLEQMLFGRITDLSEGDGLTSNTAAHLRLMTLLVSFPVISGMGILYFNIGTYFYMPLIIYPVAWFFTYMYARSVRVFAHEDLIIIRKGWLFPSRIIFPYFKAQSVELTQSIFMRPRELAHLRLFTAAGSVSVRFLNEQAARKIYDYCLYRVETSTGPWM